MLVIKYASQLMVGGLRGLPGPKRAVSSLTPTHSTAGLTQGRLFFPSVLGEDGGTQLRLTATLLPALGPGLGGRRESCGAGVLWKVPEGSPAPPAPPRSLTGQPPEEPTGGGCA